MLLTQARALLKHAGRGDIHGLVDLKPESFPHSTDNGGPERAVSPGTTRLTHVPCGG